MARKIGSRYTANQVLGRGSAGTVWLGEGPEGPVAIKLLREDLASDEELVGSFDFAVVEECFAFDECSQFSPFVAAGKAVFVAEYDEPLAAICGQAERLRFSVIRKDDELFARPWEPCFA